MGTNKQYQYEGSNLLILQLYVPTHKEESHINKALKPVFITISFLPFTFLEKYVLGIAEQYVFGSFPLA